MKKLLACALLLCSSAFAAPAISPAHTAGRFAEPTALPPTTVTFPQLIAQAQQGRVPSGARTMVAWGDYEPIFIFPLVGSTAGGGGTFFHTATMITNHRSVPQDIQLYWFRVGG